MAAEDKAFSRTAPRLPSRTAFERQMRLKYKAWCPGCWTAEEIALYAVIKAQNHQQTQGRSSVNLGRFAAGSIVLDVLTWLAGEAVPMTAALAW